MFATRTWQNISFSQPSALMSIRSSAGLEQTLHDRYSPTLNKIRPISPTNMIEPNSIGQGFSASIDGVQWLQALLLGPIATSVAVICVAGLGYRLLLGRIPTRRAATVTLGCVILFGAPTIAAALRNLAAVDPVSEAPLWPAPSPPMTVPPQEPSRPAPDPFNPYGSQPN